MDVTRPAMYDLSDYLGALRRNWWLIAFAVGLCLGGATAVTMLQAKQYQSSISVLVQPTGVQDANVVGGRTKGDINLDTEAQLVKSTAVAASAGKLLNSTQEPQQLAKNVTVTVPPNTTILMITYAEASPSAAKAGAHAFAQAYLVNRHDSAQAELNSQYTSLDQKAKEVSTQLATANAGRSGSAAQSSQQANLAEQLNVLAGRLNQLSTITIIGGKVISEANLPHSPAKPSLPLNLGSGLLTGIVLGFGLTMLRERFDSRVRRGIDLPRRTDVPLLVEISTMDHTFDPQSSSGRAFARLRNEIAAAARDLPPAGERRVIVVTSVSAGSAATRVAANLAGAFAHAGHQVSLVTEYTAGKLHTDEVRRDLEKIRNRSEYIIIEAPSAAISADAQTLAGLADAAILVVEFRRSTYAEVLDAAEQLRRVDTALLGGVVVAPTSGTAEPKPELPNQAAERQPQLT